MQSYILHYKKEGGMMMKIMIMLRLAIVFFLIVTLSHISFAKDVLMKKTALSPQEEEQFFAEVKSTKDDPFLLIMAAESDFLAKKINAQEFSNIVFTQSKKAADNDQDLKAQKLYRGQDGYFGKLFSSLWRWYYGYTLEEENIVGDQINELMKQRKIIQDQYDLVMLDDDLNDLIKFGSPVREKDILAQQYKIVMAVLDKQIHDLQAKIGDI